MNATGPRLVSVKLSPVARVQTFALPEADEAAAEALRSGEQVVVQAGAGPTVATVVRSARQLAIRRAHLSGAEPHPVRLATRDDVLTRMKQEQREREAFRIGFLKIRE